MQPSSAIARTIAGLVGLMVLASGCRTTAPIYVWHPPLVDTGTSTIIAVAPLTADPILSNALETAVLEQRPAVRADLAMVTSQQLLRASPVRLASTAALFSDLSAIQSAQAIGADIVLCGQVYSTNIDWQKDRSAINPAGRQAPNIAGLQALSADMNRSFLDRLFGDDGPADAGFHIVLSWNVVEVSTGKSLGSHEFRLASHEVLERYPDLQSMRDQPAAQLIAAAARETWQSIAPSVKKQEVLLAAPLFQLGALRTQMGVRAAKRGDWNTAEYHWQRAAWWPGFLSPAAHHNLAISQAAKEDFAAAKQALLEADGPLGFRLPNETWVWLDQHHRLYHAAHRMEPPPEGWSFPDVEEIPEQVSRHTHRVPAINEYATPWWKSVK